MKKIKFVYDWIGPRGPIPNNESPNLLQISSVSMDNILHPNTCLKFFGSSIEEQIAKFNRGFIENTSAHIIEKDDFFIYPFELHHKYHVNAFFSANHSPGILELSSLLSPGSEIFHNIKYNNGYILLHQAFEAYLDYSLFRQMHNYFNYHQVPLSKVIYQTGSPDAAKVYNEYCEQNNIQERMMVCFWDLNEYLYSQTYQDKPYQRNKVFENISKTFICLNRRYRWHRNILFSLFYKHDLLKDSFFSMPSEDPDLTGVKWIEQCDHSFLSRYSLDPQDMQNILPLMVDEASYHNMVQDSDRGLINFYDSSLLSVVTETRCDNQALQISEKTYKPIIYQKPFILVNSPGSLKYLKNAGYKTFSDFFDESYDVINDPLTRIEAIGNLCKEINDWSLEMKKEFFEKSSEIVEHNYELFCSVFPTKLKGEFWDFVRGNR